MAKSISNDIQNPEDLTGHSSEIGLSELNLEKTKWNSYKKLSIKFFIKELLIIYGIISSWLYMLVERTSDPDNQEIHLFDFGTCFFFSLLYFLSLFFWSWVYLEVSGLEMKANEEVTLFDSRNQGKPLRFSTLNLSPALLLILLVKTSLPDYQLSPLSACNVCGL